jgi:diguanylate cyclase (GGDEF)-like protein
MLARNKEVIELVRLLSEVGGASSLSQSLSIIVRIAVHSTGARRGAIYLTEPESQNLKLVASFGFTREESAQILLLTDSNGYLRSSKQSLFVTKGSNLHDAYAPHEPLRRNSVWMAIVAGGRMLGRLLVQNGESQSLGQTEEEFLRLLAAYCSTLIQNAQLYQALKRSAEQMKALYNVGRTVMSTLEIDGVLEAVVDGVTQLLGCESCSIMLIDDSGEYLTIRASRGIPEDVVKNAKRRIGEGISGIVAKTGKPYFSTNVPKDTKTLAVGSERYKSSSAICVPLVARGKVIGVMSTNNKKDSDFTLEDMNLLTLFASQAAMAIENARLHDKVHKSAITDGLTNLFVRSYLDQHLDSCISAAQRSSSQVGIIMLDLDHFKVINDTFGHQVGDEVLKGVAGIVRSSVRTSDFVGRYGGEEFVCVLADCDCGSLFYVAERIRRRVEEAQLQIGGRTLKITISLGLALFPIDGETKEALLETADLALYRAKKEGRNRICCSKKAMEARMATTGKPANASCAGGQ